MPSAAARANSTAATAALYSLSLCLAIGFLRLAESCPTCSFDFKCEQMQGLARGCLERRSARALEIAEEHGLYLPTSQPLWGHHRLVCRELEVARQCLDVLVGDCREEEIRSFLNTTAMEHHRAIKGICEMPDKPADFSWVQTCKNNIQTVAHLCFNTCRSTRHCRDCEFGASCMENALKLLCIHTMNGQQWSMLMALINAKDGLPAFCFDNPSILEAFPDIINELLERQAKWLAAKTEVDSRPAVSKTSAAPAALAVTWSACTLTAVAAAAVLALLAPAATCHCWPLMLPPAASCRADAAASVKQTSRASRTYRYARSWL